MIIPSKFDGYGEGGRLTSTRRVYDSGGSSAPATQTQVTDLPDWAKPYAQETMAKAKAVTAAPYQRYEAPRIAGFSPMQEQAMQTASGMQPSQLGQFGGQLAGAASLGALGTQYRPFQMGQFTAGRAAQYMNPFVEMAMEPQLREAQRSSEMQRMADQAQATRAGAFGGSRQAIIEAERQRNLGTQLGDIRARGFMSAFDQAQQQFAREQQLREQSRQYGAGLGLQGLQTALQGAGQLGALGGQEFGQQKDIIGLQSQLGGQQQALRQQGLSQAYQDFLNEQNYPYKQLGFMSDMIRGMPLGQQSTTQIYQPPSSLTGQVAGLGTGLLGLAAAGKTFMAEGGMVDGYAEGGDVTSAYNVNAIISDLSDAQLEQAKLAALNRGDEDRLDAINKELAQRVSMRSGLGKAFNMLPGDFQDGVISAAGGGIVALAGGGDLGVGPEFGGYVEAPSAPVGRSMSEVDRIVDALREQGQTVGLSQVKDIMSGKGDYSNVLAPAPAAVPYDRATATRREAYQTEKPAKAPTKGVQAAATALADAVAATTNTGFKRTEMKDAFAEGLRLVRDERGEADSKRMIDLINKVSKVDAPDKMLVLADFGFRMAEAASKPGATFFGSVSQGAQVIPAALAQAKKDAKEAQRLGATLEMERIKQEAAVRKGDRSAALQHAQNVRILEGQEAQLAETSRSNRVKERLLAQKAQAGSGAGLQKAYMVGLTKAQDRAAKIAKDNWGSPLLQQDLRKQGFTTFDQYYDHLLKREMKRAVPVANVSLDDDDSDEG